MNKLSKLFSIVFFTAIFSISANAQNALEDGIVGFEGTYNGRVGVYIKIKPSSEADNTWPAVEQQVGLSVGVIKKKGTKSRPAEIEYVEICKAVVYKSDEKKNVLEVRLLEDFKAAVNKKNLKVELTTETILRITWRGEY